MQLPRRDWRRAAWAAPLVHCPCPASLFLATRQLTRSPIDMNRRPDRCKGVVYCNRGCQKLHWSEAGGNHKAHCRPAPPPRPSQPIEASPDASARADSEEDYHTASDGDEPAFPCPICLDNADDAGHFGMCYKCGQMYCEDCKHRQGAGCAVCRNPFNGSDEDVVNLLHKLLEERAPGRHTRVAQRNLGYSYNHGEGVARNAEKAAALYRLSADQGCAVAQFTLADMYSSGEGVIQNFEEAATLYRLAASQHCADAQGKLGNAHLYGKGVTRCFEQAMQWFRLAAGQGHALSQHNIGVMYTLGEGVPLSHKQALPWYLLAAKQGLSDAQGALGNMYRAGNGVRKNDKEGLKWWRMAANNGHASAQCNLGLLYTMGVDVPQSYDHSIMWLERAANQGHAGAQCQLGHTHRDGNGPIKGTSRFNEAIRWYQLAADQGHADAQLQLGILHSAHGCHIC